MLRNCVKITFKLDEFYSYRKTGKFGEYYNYLNVIDGF